METKKLSIISTFDYNEKKYKLAHPTVSIVREATFKHRKAFTDSLKEGFYTKKKLELILQEGEVNVIKDYVNRRSEILKQYYEASELANKTEVPEELEYLAEILKTYREAFIQEDMSINSLFSNTAEQIAEDERINFLCFSLIKNDDDTPVWTDYTQYLNDNDYVFIERCKYEVLKWEYNLSNEVIENQPENKAIKKAEELKQKVKDELLKQVELDQESKVKEDQKESLPVSKKAKKVSKQKPSSKKEKVPKKYKRRVTEDGDTSNI